MSIDAASPLILIGAGGHAGSIVDALAGAALTAYADPKACDWLDKAGVKHLTDEQLATSLPKHAQLIMGYVGLTCDALEKRLRVLRQFTRQGAVFPPIVHPSAIVSPSATIGTGAQVLAGAIINSRARIGEGAVINSGAVIEHDAIIGPGAHIAPRAVVLGGAQVGDTAFIGSGAVVIQNSIVAPGSFTKAQSVAKQVA